ncbi:MAG TPA: (d)CMP kinase [Acidimicrobiales bacterium]|nr:(d)CMP kinase [Acidimicrobiales bacterium]
MRVIAIDGPVGSGKSTVARAVARRLGMDYLDTGAMYRSVALAALRRGIDPESADGGELARVAAELQLDVGERVVLDGEDVTDELRTPDVGRVVSAVAATPEVREELVRRQRDWARSHGGGVVEGRDIGSIVFPDAELKVFLTASDEERARRRADDEDAEALARRDRLDSTRATSPLSVADGAVVVDSTGRSVDDVVDEIVGRFSGEREREATASAPPPVPEPVAEATGARDRSSPEDRRPEPQYGPPTPLAIGMYRFVRAAIHGLARLLFRITYEGLENVPTSGAFIVAPVHRSNIDFGLVSVLTKRRMRYMGKETLWKVGWFGRFITTLGAFPVRRGAADREALHRCMEVLEGGEPLVLFPEGTRRSGPLVTDLYEGAAYVAIRTQTPLVPVGIGGSERALPKGARIVRPVKIHVVVGPPVQPPPPKSNGHPSRRDVRELTAALQAELQRLFDRARILAGDR